MKTADKAAQQRKKAERRRSHINDPAPQKWTLRNMWVIGQHLPIDWGVVPTGSCPTFCRSGMADGLPPVNTVTSIPDNKTTPRFFINSTIIYSVIRPSISG